MKGFFLIICVLYSTLALYAQKSEILDTVVIDSKTPTLEKNSGKVVSKITSEMLAQRPGATVAEVLNELSGIEISGARSNEGQNLAYYVRGGRNRQVVIMMDGVQLNDPSQISNDYDLRLIPVGQIEEIEVLKGASSVLYGSGAATAVINIKTKKASAAPISTTIRSVVSSNRPTETEFSDVSIESVTNSVHVDGTLNKWFYNASFGNTYTDGLSAIAAPENEPPFESDVFNRYNGRFNLGYKFSDSITISQFFSFDKFKAGFDDFSYQDAEHLSITDQLRTGGHFEWKYNNGTYVFNDNYSWIDREIISGFPAKYESRSYSVDNYINHRFSDNIQLVLGLNGNFSNFSSFTIPFGEQNFSLNIDNETAKFNIIDPYLNFLYRSDHGFNISAGVRANIHSVYDTHLVYQVNPSYNVDLGDHNIKVLGSYSTAYITPSLFQLYDPLFGNDTLLPEENTTLEGGVVYNYKSFFRLSAVYFSRDEDNFVDFVTIDPENFISQYQNIDETFSSNGTEIELYFAPIQKLSLSANYTLTNADERFALRIPKHKLNTSIKYLLGKQTRLGLSYQYVGDRNDMFFNPETFENETVLLDSFGLLNFSFSTQLTKNVLLFAGITNVFDAEYEEIYRFQTKGRNLQLRFELKF